MGHNGALMLEAAHPQTWKKIAIIVAGSCFAVFFAAVFYLMWVGSSLFGERPEIHTANAAQFYQENLEGLLKLPSQATLERIEHTRDYVDDHYVLTLQLPDDRAPRFWVQDLWTLNEFDKDSRGSETEYQAYHQSGKHHGFRRIHYDRPNNRYIVEIDTD